MAITHASETSDRIIPVALLARIGGDLALDFANTAGWHAREQHLEHLTDYGELLAWSRLAGAISAADAAALKQEWKLYPNRGARALTRAIQYREVLYRVFAPLAQGGRPTSADLEALHRAVAEALTAATPEWRGGRLAMYWTLDGADLDRPVYPVMIAAGDLLKSDRIGRLRQCGNHPCGWLFIDTSRNGMRRWCSSTDCGNLTRVRRFRRKQD